MQIWIYQFEDCCCFLVIGDVEETKHQNKALTPQPLYKFMT